MENELVKLLNLDADINKLQLAIEEADKQLAIFDEMIQKYEDVNNELADIIAKAYNEVNLLRIKLELKKNKLEHDLLHMEYEHAIAE